VTDAAGFLTAGFSTRASTKCIPPSFFNSAYEGREPSVRLGSHTKFAEARVEEGRPQNQLQVDEKG
jgi:hypothetical protein